MLATVTLVERQVAVDGGQNPSELRGRRTVHRFVDDPLGDVHVHVQGHKNHAGGWRLLDRDALAFQENAPHLVGRKAQGAEHARVLGGLKVHAVANGPRAGGGFFLAPGANIDHAKPENINAFLESTK